MALSRQSTKGQLLLELLLAMALSALMLPALLVGLTASRGGKAQQQERLDATTFAKEAYDALRVVREQGWSYVKNNGRYYPVLNGNTWSLISGTEIVNGFTRYMDISDVFRDINGNIVTTGGILDPSTKKITITVSWTMPYPSSITYVYYVVRTDNQIYTQSSYNDFNVGAKSNVQVTNTSGGEVKLSANTKGQWCTPQLSSATIDLPGTPNAVWAVEGHIYVSTGATATSSQDSFAHVLVANSDPPTFSLAGKIQGYKTNAVFGDSNWGYVATTNDTKEVVIVNLNQFDDPGNKIYHQEGYFNTVTDSGGGATTDAETVFVLNNRGYVTAGNYLYVFDLSSKSGSRSRIGKRIQFANSGDTAGQIYGRTVGGSTYIYIAIQGSTVEEMKIANVTNSSDNNQWKIVGSINIEPNNCSALESGKAVFVNPEGTRAYISSVNDTSFKEFFVIDTSNKANPSLVGGFATNPPCTNGGGYEANGMNPEESVVVSLLENRAILVGVSGEEYQVLNTTDEAHPSRCGGLEYNAGLYGISAVRESDGDAYAYVITGDSPRKLKVIQGGPDGPFVETGTFESATIDMGAPATFNRFNTTADIPANTNIQYQIAVADPVSGSCTNANYVFVGPDGTSNTKFASGSAIPLNSDDTGYENPGRCLRYRAYLSTTSYNTTPTLLDISFNFSL
jgi:type II secretory pathway pseudopilin PulG